MEPTTETDEVTTEPSTELDDLPIDAAKIKDGRIHKRLKVPVGNRTRGDWSHKPRQPDDGEHWKPAPPPYRRGG